MSDDDFEEEFELNQDSSDEDEINYLDDAEED
jgi:hypothetical protein